MVMKYSLQAGVRRTIFIVIADTIVFLMMYVIAEQLSHIYDKNPYLPYVIYGFNYLILLNLPAFFFKGSSWGMLLYDVKLLREGQPLPSSVIILRAVLFLPVFFSYLAGLFLLFKRNREHNIDPLFKCYILLKQAEYINEVVVAENIPNSEPAAEPEIHEPEEKNFGRRHYQNDRDPSKYTRKIL